MYITVQQAKKHLQVDECYKDDDEYILYLIKVAEDAVARNLNVPLSHLVKNGYLPQSVEHSILLLITCWLN